MLLVLLCTVLLSCSELEDRTLALAPLFGETGDNFKVTASTPLPGQTGIGARQTISITFNRNIADQRCIGAFALQPHVPGFFQTVGPVLSYTPSKSFSTGETYVISVSRQCEDKEGRDLETAYIASFAVGNEIVPPTFVRALGRQNASGCLTADPLVALYDPDTGAAGGSDFCQNTPIRMQFSESMDQGSVIRNFLIAPPSLGSYAWNSTSDTVTFTSRDGFINGITYVVTIDTGAADTSGNEISDPLTFAFTVGNDFIAPSLDPSGGSCRGEVCGDTMGSGCTGTSAANIGSAPTDVCRLAAQQRLEFNFSEPMDRPATQNSFSIEPYVVGTLSFAAPNQMLFRPATDLQVNTQYRITIASSAKDLAGNATGTDFIRYFTTGNGSGDGTPPAIVAVRTDRIGSGDGCNANADQVVSSGFAGDVCTANVAMPGPGAVIEIQFSEAMDRSTTAGAFSLNPPVAGTITWPAANTLRIISTNSLIPDTLYTLSFAVGARDLNSNSIASAYSLYFQTSGTGGYPGVLSISIEAGAHPCGTGGINTVIYPAPGSDTTNGCIGSPTISPITIAFSEAMNRSATESAFSISPIIAGAFSWNAASTRLTFRPDQQFAYGQRYNIAVGTAAQDAQTQTLQASVAATFVVGALDVSPPGVLGISFETTAGICGDGIAPDDIANAPQGSIINNVCRTQAIDINFSEAMDKAATASALSLSPFSSYALSWISATTLRITPVGAGFNSATVYAMSVASTARDLAGNALPADFSLSFVTENDAPRVRAIGLASQTGCNLATSMGPASGVGSDWNAATCWWDDTKPLLAASSYLFKGGNSACYADAATDNIVLIFSRPMNPATTAAAIYMQRISPGIGTIQLASYQWDPGFQILTLSFADTMNSNCASPSPGNFDLSLEDAGTAGVFTDGDGVAGYPFYSIEVDQTATDASGNPLGSSFVFSFEGGDGP